MNPDYSVSVAGENITPALNPRLKSLTLTDKRAFEADELTLSLDVSDGTLALPRLGATVQLSLGFAETGLIDKGTFVVDELTQRGSPDVLSLVARSADFHKGLNEQKRRSFFNKPLGEVLKTIADDHGLELKISEALAWKNPGHIDQTSESDGNLMARLGRQFDAVATIKAGRLLFIPMAGGTTAGGLQLAAMTIARGDGDRYSFSRKAGSTDYSGVKANWHDIDAGTRKTVTAGGGTTPEKFRTLAETFEDAVTAQAEANSEWNRIKRGRDTMSLTLAIGQPALTPETPVTVSGWHPEIDALSWSTSSVTHSLNGSGLTTRVELEGDQA